MVTHSIKVLGRDLQVKSEATPEEVAEVESLVNTTLTEAGAAVTGGDSQLVVILALINLAGACLKARKESEELQQSLDGRVAALLARIDRSSI